MFHFMGEEPRKLDGPAILRDTLAEAGPPAERLIARASQPEVNEQLIADEAGAHEGGAFGTPSLLAGEKLYSAKTDRKMSHAISRHRERKSRRVVLRTKR